MKELRAHLRRAWRVGDDSTANAWANTQHRRKLLTLLHRVLARPRGLHTKGMNVQWIGYQSELAEKEVQQRRWLTWVLEIVTM